MASLAVEDFYVMGLERDLSEYENPVKFREREAPSDDFSDSMDEARVEMLILG